jgi:hypothetical protein
MKKWTTPKLLRKPKRMSQSMIGRTGQPAPSWTPAPELSALANECFRACLSPYAKPDLIRVFRNNSDRYLGKCFVNQRIIVITRSKRDWFSTLSTLAHEIAHLRVKSHGPKHENLTEELYAWFVANTEVEKVA